MLNWLKQVSATELKSSLSGGITITFENVPTLEYVCSQVAKRLQQVETNGWEPAEEIAFRIDGGAIKVEADFSAKPLTAQE